MTPEEKKSELTHDKDVSLENGKIVMKAEMDYGKAVEADLTVKVDAIEALKAIAEMTPTEKDDKFLASAEPYVRMIMSAIEKK